MSDTPKITIYVRNETFLQSLANDIASIAIIAGPIALNEMTLQSTALNFMLGILGILSLIGWASTYGDDKRVRGETTEEVLRKVKQKLTALNGEDA